MLKALLSLLGIDRRIRQARIALGEGVLAAEDRAQLLRMAWDEEKERLRLMLVLVIATIGLTTVMVALVSVAVVVHFWDTPQRVAAAWVVALVWVLLWAGSVVALVRTMRQASNAFAPARQEFERDVEWLHERFGRDNPDDPPKPREPRPATREELLARIATQRERIATLQGPRRSRSTQDGPDAAAAAAAAANESPTETAVRLAREHPIATAAVAAATVAVVGPRRLLRWATWALPVLWKMR